jgi:hypothetical protein
MEGARALFDVVLSSHQEIATIAGPSFTPRRWLHIAVFDYELPFQMLIGKVH